LRDRAIEILARFGEHIDVSTPVKRLAIGQRQMVEIAKALSRGANIIAFDEPPVPFPLAKSGGCSKSSVNCSGRTVRSSM